MKRLVMKRTHSAGDTKQTWEKQTARNRTDTDSALAPPTDSESSSLNSRLHVTPVLASFPLYGSLLKPCQDQLHIRHITALGPQVGFSKFPQWRLECGGDDIFPSGPFSFGMTCQTPSKSLLKTQFYSLAFMWCHLFLYLFLFSYSDFCIYI